MSRLVFPAPMLDEIRQTLLAESDETCAIAYGRAVKTDRRLARIVVSDYAPVSPTAYRRRSSTAAVLSPEYVATISQRVRREGLSAVFIHTHPFDLDRFSQIDDRGEAELRQFFERRTPGITHAALLLTPNTSSARLLGHDTPLSVWQVGSNLYAAGHADETIAAVADRQVRAFGPEGQRRLQRLTVGVVGLGGTGSVVAQQLAHLGVRRLLLMDHDVVEETNLNRLVGASRADIGRHKVEVAHAYLKRINPVIEVRANRESVLVPRQAHRLVEADVVFCCTDSHGSRVVLNQLAYQYLLPVIDLGVVIAAKEGQVTHVIGRAQLLAPTLSCLACDNVLDPEQVRRDFLTPEERQADPYIVGGEGERQPAVISLNSTVASLSVTMLLQMVAGIPGLSRRLHYNAVTGATRPVQGTPCPTCIVCSRQGALARGDSIPLPGRIDL